MLIWKAAMKLFFLSFILTLPVRINGSYVYLPPSPLLLNNILDGVAISVFALNMEDRGIEP